MKTAVDKVGRGKEHTVNARFQAMTGHYLFEPEFCNRAAGWEKGVVEKNVQDRRRQLWANANGLHWPSLEDELPHLMSNPQPFDGYIEQPVRVSTTVLFHYQRSRYSVPAELALESGNISGDHVLNVLARLQSPLLPQTPVETSLTPVRNPRRMCIATIICASRCQRR